jgi:hypothetical protein
MFKIEKENSNIELFMQVGTLLKGVWHDISFFHESVIECLSAVSLTPVDKREEFYHLAC